MVTAQRLTSVTKTKWLLPLLGSMALIAFLCHRLDAHRITNFLREANWTFLLIACFLTVPFVLIKTLKWYGGIVCYTPTSPEFPICSHFVPS